MDRHFVSYVKRRWPAGPRGRAAIVVIAVAVAAAIAVPLALTGRSTVPPPDRPGPGATAVTQRWAAQDGAVAAGFGAIWALACCDRNVSRSWVDQLDPRTRALIHRIPVRTPTSSIAVGAGRVWVIGSNPGGGGPSEITSVEPGSLKASSYRIRDSKEEPDDIAFTPGLAWVTFQLSNQAWRLGPGLGHGPAGGFEITPIRISGGPTDIATTGDGELWVQRQEGGQLTQLVPRGASARLGRTVSWRSAIFSSPLKGELLAKNAGGTIGELAPTDLSGCGACAQVGLAVAPGTVFAAVMTKRGLYVATSRGTYFYAGPTMDSTGRPTASIPNGGSLAPDGNGVVIGTGSYGLIHWVPSG